MRDWNDREISFGDREIPRKKRAALVRLGKGLGALAVLIVLMLWLSGAFVRKVGPEAARPEPVAAKAANGQGGAKNVPFANRTGWNHSIQERSPGIQPSYGRSQGNPCKGG